ncbi:hypothetical protein [Acetobacterium carbinolicum]|uniref:hypothetical protein n=1 Tax=Acetobacterium carbinolicum TaxID=52690 RepID=UPI0039C9E0A1
MRLIKNYEAGTYEVIRQFKSKKNRVRLIKISDGEQVLELIEKKFAKTESLENELAMLKLLSDMDFSVALCRGRFDRVLLYEYLEGVTLCEKLEVAEAQETSRSGDTVMPGKEIIDLFKKTIDWLNRLHQKTGLAFYDINLRNFIIRDGTVYAIDYEDSQALTTAVDYGRLLAFTLTYRPSFTQWKKALISELEDYLKNQIKADLNEIRLEKEKELVRIKKRRAKLV